MKRQSFPYGYTQWRQIVWHVVLSLVLILLLYLTRGHTQSEAAEITRGMVVSRVCAMGQPIEFGVDGCVCEGFIYLKQGKDTAQMYCGGRCMEGYTFKNNTDGEPVCVRKKTVEERLDAIEESLADLLRRHQEK